jgi:hypothetical protein
MKEVYTIGLVRWKDDRSDAHCNSVYSSLEKAKLCAEKDGSFLSDDGYYQYLVIEKVPLDKPYGISHMQLWYKYDRGVYRNIDT